MSSSDCRSDVESAAVYLPMDEPAVSPTAAAAGAVTKVASHTAKRQEAAALLAVWSALVLTEGTVRFILSGPAGDLTPAGRMASTPPPLLAFTAALAECIFGLTGVLVGVGGAFFAAHNRAVTRAFLISQTVLSWYVFAVYVFLLPAYRARFLNAPVFPFGSVPTSRAFLSMGILTSVALCLALQGGQFAFGVRLLAHQSPAGKASGAESTKAARRGLFWNANMTLGGVSTAVAGALLVAADAGGVGRLEGVFVAPPHVGVFPLMTLVTGLVAAATGAVGMLASMRSAAVRSFLAVSVVNFVLGYLNFTVVQLGAIKSGGPPEAAAFHSGLVLLTALIGPYFAHQARVAREEAASAVVA